MPSSRFQKGGLARTEYTFVYGHRHLTDEEREANERDPHYRGLDDAGEPRMQPEYKPVRLELGALLHVVRARVSPPAAMRIRGKSWVLVLDSKTGHEIYVRADHLRPV